MRRFWSLLHMGIAILCLPALPAAAQPHEAQPQVAQTVPVAPQDQAPISEPVLQLHSGHRASDEWRFSLGVGGLYAPTYLGSNNYDLDPLPLIDIRYRDRLFLSTRDGLGINLLSGSNWRAGPVLKYRRGRDQDDDAALHGLGDVDPAGEIGGFVHYDLRPFTMGAEIRQGFGGHDGVIGDLFFTWTTLFNDRTQLSLGPKLSLGSRDINRKLFRHRCQSGGALRLSALRGRWRVRLLRPWRIAHLSARRWLGARRLCRRRPPGRRCSGFAHRRSGRLGHPGPRGLEHWLQFRHRKMI